jgi:hypothetical protein
MATTYTPNPFAGGASPAATQAAQVTALRGYAPNAFATSSPNWNTGPAPHLSVPEAARPFAQEVSLLRGIPGLKQPLPDLDKQWRFSPQSYERKVGTLLQGDPYVSILADEKQKQQMAASGQYFDDDGNIRSGPRRGLNDGD